MTKQIGSQWIERGLLMVETERGPDVFRGTCDVCDMPAIFVDAIDDTRCCWTHTRREAADAREGRVGRMTGLLRVSSLETVRS